MCFYCSFGLVSIVFICCCNLWILCFYFLGHLLVQLILRLCPVDTFVLLGPIMSHSVIFSFVSQINLIWLNLIWFDLKTKGWTRSGKIGVYRTADVLSESGWMQRTDYCVPTGLYCRFMQLAWTFPVGTATAELSFSARYTTYASGISYAPLCHRTVSHHWLFWFTVVTAPHLSCVSVCP